MSKRIKCIFVIAVISIFAAFLALGCTPARRPVPEVDRYKNKVVPERYNDQRNLTYDNIPNRMRDYAVNKKGENVALEREIERMSGIEDAVVILDRDTCYVGVDTDTGVPIENMKAMQTRIASKVREKMPSIVRVYVTSEEDRVKRLRGFRTSIMNGRDVREFVNQIKALF
ncbi:YhcN/YlaJ family sporulation lipoprotein [Crassaminicella indica]|uniref:YhcN/YlaJ family sporulation lipoprotein n=1 Tax=Crassaminicella indica TaxID=2855394 RepID=A0ABX8RCN4_9CLOT|nr:YhcN/YlaJ family sporulation lipoprotein [Crassaminicella indica]QXM06822.1 YhcN/YlaJ family sporulation lipoprotein [Crassaminicella indica]